MSTKIATLNIVVEGVQLTCGEEVDVSELPSGCVESMVRLGQLVEPKDYIDEPEQEAESEDDAKDLLSVSVDQLGLSANAEAALAEAGILTVGDIAEYGEEHGSLTAIDGIGDSTEKSIQEAIGNLKS